MTAAVAQALLGLASSGTSFTTGGSTTGSDVALTTTSGNTIVIRASFGDASQYPTGVPTDSKGNTYVAAVTRQADNSGGAMSIWYCSNITGGSSHTFSCSFNGSVTNGLVFEVIELSGVTTSSYDSAVTASTLDTGSPYTVTSGTPSQANEIILSFYQNGDSGGGTFTCSGWNIIQTTNNSTYWLDGSSYLVISSAVAQTPSWTYSASGTHNAVAVVGFKASSGATAKTAAGSLNAAIQSAKTATASMSSAIRLARTATGSIGAAVAVRNTATASAGAAVLAAKTASGSLSAAVQVLRATNTSVGAAVAVQNTSSASLGGAVAVQSTVSSSLGSVIQVARSASASLSAALQAAASVNASTSAAVQTSSTVSANLEAALQAAHAANQSLDTAILFEASVTASVNAYINDTSITAVTASLNAAVQQALSATANLQAAVQLSQTLSTSLDSALQVSGSLSASLDADIFAGFFATASLDAAIQNASSAAASLDAYISDGVTISSVGGWMPSRKTKEQRGKERRELGILPEIEVPVTAAEVRELTHEDRQRAQRAAKKLLERFAPEPTAPVAAVALPAPNEQPTIGPVELPIEVQATLIAAQKKRAFEQDLVYIVATLIS